MKKKLLVSLTLVVVAISSVFCETEQVLPSKLEVSQALDVIVDCFSSTVAATYSASRIDLPSCAVSMDSQTKLPTRIAFFLADPYQFQLAFKTASGVQQNLIAAILSLLQNQEKDPLISSAYMALSSKNYQTRKCLVNGYINISYPENTTLDNLANFFLSRERSDGSLAISVSLSVIQSSSTPVVIAGNFKIALLDNGLICVNSLEPYTINGHTFEDGELTF